MDATPLLERIARALALAKLEAILIGNAAAALHGAPVTTLDFDFVFRNTPGNVRKLRRVADELGAVVFRPYYPTSSMFRVIDEDVGLQVDFLSAIPSLKSLERVRKNAVTVRFGTENLVVASLEDVVRSKRAADLPTIARCSLFGRRLLRKRNVRRDVKGEHPASSEAAIDPEWIDMIERLLRKPMNKRTHFLRKRLPGGGSCL